jgi:phosphodiesterase/alkaline phosphatase D-like protein
MRKTGLTRRDFFRLTSFGLAAAACTGGDPDAAGPDAGPGTGGDAGEEKPPLVPRNLDALQESSEFALGVMAGDATSDSVILWTNYGGPNRLVVHVQLFDGTPVYEETAHPTPGGFAHVDARPLSSAARYRYAFLELDKDDQVIARSPIGKFRCAIPDEALETITFAGVSCTSQFQEVTNANLARLAARTDLSFVLHAGDQLYADFPSGEPATDLASYRAKYAYAWAQPGLKALHQNNAMYNTWDDHEVYNNWQGVRDVPRIEAGVQTFFEHQPIRRETANPNRIYRSFKWGRTLELFVLDCRGERDLDNGKYMSDAQVDWLCNGVASSKAVFKMVLNSCPIGMFPDGINQWRAPTDRWANPAWSAQRTKVLDASQQAGGVWWLSGDFHFGTVGRVQYGNNTMYPRVREVLMGAGGSGLGTSTEIPGTTRIMQVKALDDNQNWTFSTPENNYTIIRANPEPDATHAKPWLNIAFYDATTQLLAAEYGLL